jgi:hypothetical protein
VRGIIYFRINKQPNGYATGVLVYRLAASVFYFLLLITFACCSHLRTPAPFPGDGQCPDEHALLDAIHVPAPPVLKGIAKIKVESPDETFSVKELIVAQTPNRLRLGLKSSSSRKHRTA